MPDFYTWNDETEKADFIARSEIQEQRSNSYALLLSQSESLIGLIQYESISSHNRLSAIRMGNIGKAGCLEGEQIANLLHNIESMKLILELMKKLF